MTRETSASGRAKSFQSKAMGRLNALAVEVHNEAKAVKSERRQLSILMSDMTSSTARKLSEGQKSVTGLAMAHNLLCRRLVDQQGGQTIKELGDGVLCTFNDPYEACKAALLIKLAMPLLGDIATKTAISTGVVQVIQMGERLDVYGEPVDRCARILSAALPSQVLMDDVSLDSARGWLADHKKISWDGPFEFDLRGIGPTECFEIGLEGDFIGTTSVPFAIEASGRLSPEVKARFIRAARDRIVELGSGLTTFADYLEGSRPGDRIFADAIRSALERGVTIECYAANPESPLVAAYFKDRREAKYVSKVGDALASIVTWREEEGWSESFFVSVYDHIPYLHALAIDPHRPDGRMMISQYLFGIRRADTPYMQLSRLWNPDLHDKLWASVERLISKSRPWADSTGN